MSKVDETKKQRSNGYKRKRLEVPPQKNFIEKKDTPQFIKEILKEEGKVKEDTKLVKTIKEENNILEKAKKEEVKEGVDNIITSIKGLFIIAPSGSGKTQFSNEKFIDLDKRYTFPQGRWWETETRVKVNEDLKNLVTDITSKGTNVMYADDLGLVADYVVLIPDDLHYKNLQNIRVNQPGIEEWNRIQKDKIELSEKYKDKILTSFNFVDGSGFTVREYKPEIDSRVLDVLNKTEINAEYLRSISDKKKPKIDDYDRIVMILDDMIKSAESGRTSVMVDLKDLSVGTMRNLSSFLKKGKFTFTGESIIW